MWLTNPQKSYHSNGGINNFSNDNELRELVTGHCGSRGPTAYLIEEVRLKHMDSYQLSETEPLEYQITFMGHLVWDGSMQKQLTQPTSQKTTSPFSR